MEKRAAEMREEVKSLQLYMGCIMENSDDIIEALSENDFSTIKEIFSKCKVPKNKMKPLLSFVLDSYRHRYDGDW